MSSKIFPASPILLVDDEEHFLLSVELTLSSNGITNIETCRDSRQVMQRLSNKYYSLVALDINMQYLSGIELLRQITSSYPEIPVIMMTAVNDVDSAVLCIKEGAFDYVVKPISDTKLVTTIKRGLELGEIRNENEMLKQSLLRENVQHPEAFKEIVTRSAPLRSIFSTKSDCKNKSAGAHHRRNRNRQRTLRRSGSQSERRKGQLVSVNVAGVDDDFFSDTLFGHKKGAFTGAESERKGLIEKADDGTVFLDEIGDLNIASQVKLLRLLQDGSFYPLGSDIAKLSDARIIVATHRDIKTMQAGNTFRQDLYYRLKSHHIAIPPLREQTLDVPYLIDYFISKAATALNKKKPTVPKELYTLLANYPFPGNVRELEGMIFEAVSLHLSGILSLESIRKNVADQNQTRNSKDAGLSLSQQTHELLSFPSRFPTLEEAESSLIEEALKRAEGNQTIAAELLGISRRALNNRLRRTEKK